MDLSNIFWLELLGTATLILFGGGVCANVNLKDTLGHASGWIVISFGWGFAVFAGVVVAFKSGAHLNPAVTFGLLADGAIGWKVVPAYIGGQMLGAFLGAILVWLTYKKQFDVTEDPGAILGTFSTGPTIKAYGWNFFTEVVGTFTLVFVVIHFSNGGGPAGLGALPVAFLVVAIGLSLGGPTGYAINPARDLAPRIAHAILPIPHKGGSNWAYAWVPVFGPIVGGVLAGLLAHVTVALH